MSPPNDTRDEGLDALFEDLLLEPAIDDDLLIAYAQAPESLSSAQRAEVEAALRADPQLRDQLRVLQRFDPAVLAEGAGKAAPQSGGGAEVISIFDRARRLNKPLLALALPLAAVLAMVLLRPGTEDVTGSESSTPAGGVEVANEMGAAGGTPEAGAPEPLPRRETQFAGRPPAEKQAEVERPQPRAPEVIEEEPVLLAFVDPVYTRAAGAADRVFDMPAYRGGLIQPPPAPIALAPGHVARSASPQPTLHWYSSHTDEGGGFHLSIYEAESEEWLVDRARLQKPSRPGVQRIELGGLGARLEPGVEYVWEIERWIQSDPNRGVQRTVGWIQHAPLSAAARQTLEATDPLERPAWFAARGYWYDTISALDALRDEGDDPAPLDASLEKLLEAEGISLEE